MTKTLVIAEKPSVAQDIVRALTPVAGKFDKHDEHFENEKYVVTSAVGHLVEIQAPEEFDVKRGKWSFANLPVIPPYFDLKPVDKTKTRLNAVVKQAKRKDVTRARQRLRRGPRGRADLPPDRAVRRRQERRWASRCERLWLQSMTPQAIRDGFDAAAQRQADAGPGRRGALALRGRLAGRHQRHARHDGLQLARRRLLPDHRRPGADADAVGGGRARRADPQVRQPRLLGSPRAASRPRPASTRASGSTRAGRSRRPDPTASPTPNSAPTASGTSARRRPSPTPCAARPATVTEESKPTTQASPLLFDLTSLQREANGRFGFSAKTTLALAQSLYERHKALTYPRTDSRALPEDYLPVVKRDHGDAGRQRHEAPGAASRKQALDGNYVKPSKRIFDNAKVSDHFAIIPTLQAPSGLSDAEQKLYDLVVRRFLSVFFPSAEYQVTTRISTVASGSTASRPTARCWSSRAGWRSTARKPQDDERREGRQEPGAGEARRDGARRSRSTPRA